MKALIIAKIIALRAVQANCSADKRAEINEKIAALYDLLKSAGG
jgi:hypothetical protein